MAKWTIISDRLGKNPVYFKDGAVVTEEQFHAEFPSMWRDDQIGDPSGAPGGHNAGCWPQVSEALGVHKDQVAEANERARAAGVNVTYDREGFAVIPDRAARRELLKLDGCHDRDGGYSDG